MAEYYCVLLVVLETLVNVASLQLQEPAILIATGAYMDTDATSDSRHYFVLTCAAYGEPLPSVAWSFRKDGRSVPIGNNDTGTFLVHPGVVTSDLEGYGIEVEVSILIVCGADIERISAIKCSATNGVSTDGLVGYQIAQFQVSSFSTCVFAEEVSETCLALSSQQTTETSMTTTTATGIDSTVLIISVSVVICFFIASLTIILILCVFAIMRKKDSNRGFLGAYPHNQTPLEHPYTNLHYELRNRKKSSVYSGAPSAPVAGSYNKVSSVPVQFTSTHNQHEEAAGYSNLRLDWSMDQLSHHRQENGDPKHVRQVDGVLYENTCNEEEPSSPDAGPTSQMPLYEETFTLSCENPSSSVNALAPPPRYVMQDSLVSCNVYGQVDFDITDAADDHAMQIETGSPLS